ncbi:hypothetical protein Hdeb2414_s0337g00871261 [Helianthus debilis subsp. tardiflorus]
MLAMMFSWILCVLTCDHKVACIIYTFWLGLRCSGQTMVVGSLCLNVYSVFEGYSVSEGGSSVV